jgi:hypothetical protein
VKSGKEMVPPGTTVEVSPTSTGRKKKTGILVLKEKTERFIV